MEDLDIYNSFDALSAKGSYASSANKMTSPIENLQNSSAFASSDSELAWSTTIETLIPQEQERCETASKIGQSQQLLQHQQQFSSVKASGMKATTAVFHQQSTNHWFLLGRDMSLLNPEFLSRKRETAAATAVSGSGNNRRLIATDRFVPSRKASRMNLFQAYERSENDGPLGFNNENEATMIAGRGVRFKNAVGQEEINTTSIAKLYKAKVLGMREHNPTMNNSTLSGVINAFTPFRNHNMLRFSSNENTNITQNSSSSNNQSSSSQASSIDNILSLASTQDDLTAAARLTRKIPKLPFKVLDAPALQDDFYLNLIDWSEDNVLAVALSSCVYLWSAKNSRVTKLCDFHRPNEVTSVSWSPLSPLVSVGKNSGDVEIWDSVKMERVRVMSGHSQRVGALAWQDEHTMTSGSRDKSILIRDTRTQNPFESKLTGHKQEVCGLKWSFDKQQLASGGNDNKLILWNAKSTKPVDIFTNHNAAVKALAWSPHQHGLLASGGGTQDRTIRFWNTLTSKQLECVETGSQVCNLAFSKSSNELVSTHGYSQNQVIVWNYPDMEKLATLTGHSCRVLYLAMSPDGSTVVTGAGDETLRFWNVFHQNSQAVNHAADSRLLAKNCYIR